MRQLAQGSTTICTAGDLVTGDLVAVRGGLYSPEACTRRESSTFAFSNSARRVAVSPFPARLIKYVNIRKPETGPFGETFFDAIALAIVKAFFLNNPSGG
jgi:hypothetical protein